MGIEGLEEILPEGKKYQLFHFQSKPRETRPLITQETQQNDLKTIKIEHFLALGHDGIIFFGLEIFIYLTIDYSADVTEKVLFVSKADTNGFNKTNVKIGRVTQLIISHLLQIPIESYLYDIIRKPIKHASFDKNSINKLTSTQDALHIILKRHTGELPKPTKPQPYSITDYPKRIKQKIALFTRAEPQYLFPDSNKNPSKHILNGEKLLKWWLKSLDQIIIDEFDQDSTSANLQIPAEDPKVITRYLEHLKFNWKIGDIFHGKDDDIAVFKIPLFSDDPKARFLEHLVVENRVRKVTLKRFWQELQVRQEFRLGATVSVIGIEGELKIKEDNNSNTFDRVVLSLKPFKKLKGYITGEDYSTEDGAVEAYKNITDYLESQLNKEVEEITGREATKINTHQPTVLTAKRASSVNNLNTLIRKKPKNK